jgi:hypothetical protein
MVAAEVTQLCILLKSGHTSRVPTLTTQDSLIMLRFQPPNHSSCSPALYYRDVQPDCHHNIGFCGYFTSHPVLLWILKN